MDVEKLKEVESHFNATRDHGGITLTSREVEGLIELAYIGLGEIQVAKSKVEYVPRAEVFDLEAIPFGTQSGRAKSNPEPQNIRPSGTQLLTPSMFYVVDSEVGFSDEEVNVLNKTPLGRLYTTCPVCGERAQNSSGVIHHESCKLQSYYDWIFDRGETSGDQDTKDWWATTAEQIKNWSDPADEETEVEDGEDL